MNKLKLTSVVVAVLALVGCAATEKAEKQIEVTNKKAENVFEGSRNKVSSASIPNNDSNKRSNFVKSGKRWVNPSSIPNVEEQAPMPEFFNKQVVTTMAGTTTAIEILTELQRSLGTAANNLKITIAPEVYNLTPSTPKIIKGEMAVPPTPKETPIYVSDFVFTGTLKDALDLFANKTNLSWKWDGKEIKIFKYETKTYNISALAGATTARSSVSLTGGTAGSASSGTGGNAQAANSGAATSAVAKESSISVWSEVQAFLMIQLSPEGHLAQLEGSGEVVIRDTPAVHAKLEKEITKLNESFKKQVFINVDVYSLSRTDADNYGIDWNMLWSGALNSASFVTTVGATANATSKFTANVTSGMFAGSSAVLSALSTLGKATLVNNFNITTTNGKAAPIASNKKVGYMASISSQPSTVQGQPPTVTLTPGEIVAGINMSVTPKVEPNGDILLDYVMNLSDVLDIRTFTSGSNSIEIPTSTLKTMTNSSVLRSGQTLILSGFKQQKVKREQSGVGSPSNILLGGKQNASVEDEYLVITVTPYLAQANTKR